MAYTVHDRVHRRIHDLSVRVLDKEKSSLAEGHVHEDALDHLEFHVDEHHPPVATRERINDRLDDGYHVAGTVVHPEVSAYGAGVKLHCAGALDRAEIPRLLPEGIAGYGLDLVAQGSVVLVYQENAGDLGVHT